MGYELHEVCGHYMYEHMDKQKKHLREQIRSRVLVHGLDSNSPSEQPDEHSARTQQLNVKKGK